MTAGVLEIEAQLDLGINAAHVLAVRLKRSRSINGAGREAQRSHAPMRVRTLLYLQQPASARPGRCAKC